MAAKVKVIGTAKQLLILAVLTQMAHADIVTWRRCKETDDDRGRLLSWWRTQDHDADVINLEYCNITEIKASGSDFNGLPNLETIWLKNNNIQHLNPAVFSTVPKVSYLDLNNNDLTEMPALLLPNLKMLVVEYNKINKLHDPSVFSSMKELSYIFLEHNRIEYIHPLVFQGLTNLRKIDLRNNRLTYIPGKLFSIRSLENVSLAFNFIEYVAAGAFRGSQLLELSIQRNRLNYLPEKFLLELNNSSAQLLDIYFFDNPFLCSCLLELLAEVKKIDKCEYHFNSYSGGKQVCLALGECKRLSENEYYSLRSINRS